MADVATAVGARLSEVESKPHLLQLPHTRVFDDLLPSLGALDSTVLADHLLDWRLNHPSAFWLLLQGLSTYDTAATRATAEAFLRRWSYWDEDERALLDPVLAAAFPTLPQPLQALLLSQRPAIRTTLGLQAGHSDASLGASVTVDPTALPHIDTVAGVQARLHLHGFPCGPISGDWNRNTHQALFLFQFEFDMDATGQINEETLRWLAELPE